MTDDDESSSRGLRATPMASALLHGCVSKPLSNEKTPYPGHIAMLSMAMWLNAG